MARGSIWALLFLLGFALAVTSVSQMRAEVSEQIEVRVPQNSAVMYIGAAPAMGMALASSGSSSVGQPPYCDDSPTDPSLCLRPEDTAVYFDLRCATLGAVPVHCPSLYPELPEGRFLDDEGRPYPPLKLNEWGMVIPGSKQFPQFFTHPSLRLSIFTTQSNWDLSVAVLAPLEDPTSGRTLGENHLAVHSILTGSGNANPPSPEWKCLGEAPDWPPSVICPAPAGVGGGVLLEAVRGYAGGWQSVTLGIKLRLDGSEAPGNYQGVLVYSLTLL